MIKYLAAFILLIHCVLLKAQATEANYQLIRATPDHLAYFEHLPDAYENTGSSYPLILFLHGLGERDGGNEGDIQKLLKWGPPRIVSQNRTDFSAIHPYRFIILAPQQIRSKASWSADDVHKFLMFALEKYRIDENRIYLTGISMGGNGVWEYAYSSFNEPNRIAAIAPISAWGDNRMGCRIIERSIPVWAFHGTQDNVVAFRRGRSMFTSMADCGSELDNRMYRFSPINAAHTAWPEIYSSVSDSLSIYDWFMSITLNQDTLKSGKKTAEADTVGLAPWVAPPFMNVELTMLGQLPQSLNENSGLALEKEGNFWTHNDSGNEPNLYLIDSSGTILREVRIASAVNTDWEDLARDKDGNMYIADMGNGQNIRNKLTIYKVSPEDLNKDIPEADVIHFVYEDQSEYPPSRQEMHYDAESLIHYDGSLYIFTKNRTEPFTGYTHIYRLPDQPGDYTAQLVDSIKLGDGMMTNFWLTGADISPSGDRIALLSHDKVWILTCFNGKKFSEGRLTELRLNSYSQKESIVFRDDFSLLLSDERIRNILGGNIYRLNIPGEAIKSCE